MELVSGFSIIFLLMIGIVIASLIFTILALIDILKSEFKESNAKLIWILVVIFLGIIGAIIYFAIGREQRVDKDLPPYNQSKWS